MDPRLRTLLYLGIFLAFSKSTEAQITSETEAEVANGPPGVEPASSSTNPTTLNQIETTEAVASTSQSVSSVPLPEASVASRGNVSPQIFTIEPVVSPSTSIPTEIKFEKSVTPITKIMLSVTENIVNVTANEIVHDNNHNSRSVSDNVTSSHENVPEQVFTIEPVVSPSTSSSTESPRASSSTESPSTSSSTESPSTSSSMESPRASSSTETKFETSVTPIAKITPSVTENIINVTSNEIVYNNNHGSSSAMDNVTAETETLDEIDTSAIYLKFKGNCLAENHTYQNMDFVEFREKGNDVCQLTLKVVPVENREEVFNQLRQLVGKLRIYHDDVPMKLTEMESNFEYFVTNDTSADDNWRFVKGPSYNEFVAYVVIGCSFGVLLCTALCLLCIKCCRCSKKNELRDIPHLTLKLEDYALTRIPRPNTLYSETSKIPIISDDTSTVSVQGLARSTNSHNDGARMSRAYDTGVVPMEEYEYDGHTHYATPGFHNGAQNGKEMRTFRVKNESPTKHGEMEERVSYNHDSIATNSTEKLARDFYRRQAPGYGEENPVYKT